MEKIQLTRVFRLQKAGKTITLPDPGEDMTADQVRKFYSSQHPELVTSSASGPAYEGENAVYTFKATVGTKG